MRGRAGESMAGKIMAKAAAPLDAPTSRTRGLRDVPTLRRSRGKPARRSHHPRWQQECRAADPRRHAAGRRLVDPRQCPPIRDVEADGELLADLGATVDWTGPNTVRVDPGRRSRKPLDPRLCARIRASILLAGPLLARFGMVALPPPGGDVIGRRRVDTHFLALEAARRRRSGRRSIRDRGRRKLVGADIFLDEPSVTGTENAMMAAVAATGTDRSSATPPPSPTCRTSPTSSSAMGAEIEGIGTNTYTVRGGDPLHGCRTHGSDPITSRSASFIGLAAVTDGAAHDRGRARCRPPRDPASGSTAWASGPA